ncbi:MAG: hypothetical protein JWM11_3012 [Planctomycetaceae bacterium]|nr:hypothetical protein [Planctomycetaceae bacterium]
MDVSRLLQVVSSFAGALAKRQRRRKAPFFATDSVETLETRVVPAAIQVVPVAGTTTSESGGTAQFTVILTTQPKSNVTIPLVSSNTAEGTVNVKQLVFTAKNWSTPQTFTVKGIDDTVVDGDKAYHVTLGKFRTTDKGYKALTPITENLINLDNDVPGINVTAGNNLQTTEAGGKATFTVKLATKPTANVVIPLQSTNLQEGTVTSSLTFTPTNWNQSQTATITGVNDAVVDGNQAYQIVFGAATSADTAYAGKTPSPISVTNIDNDVAGLSVSPKTGLTVDEGASKNVAFKLTAQPADDVTVTLMVNVGDSQATLSTTTLTFSPANWNTTQNVAINGLLGDGIDGDQPFAFTVDTSSTDALFNNLPTQTVSSIIHDTEAPAPNYDGTYTGSYSGSVKIFGVTTPQNGNIAATVLGNTFTMTQPFTASGTLAGDGTVNVTVPVSPSEFSGLKFTGTTKKNSDGSVTVSGTWTVNKPLASGGGTWTITKAAPMA